MKTFFNYIITFILGGIVSYFICSKYLNKIEEKIIIKYKTITDTKYIPTPKIKWVSIPSDTIIIHDTLQFIDSCKLLTMDYNTKRYYVDTLQFDSLGNCIVESYVYQNKLNSLGYNYNIIIPERTTEKFVITNNNLYISTLIGNNVLAPLVGIDIKNYYVGVGYNIYNNSMLFNLTYKIKWKKH